MNQNDILFALYMNDGHAGLDWLASYLCRGEQPAQEEAFFYQSVQTLTSAGLIKLTVEDSRILASLTGPGNQAAVTAADYLYERTMDQWERRGILIGVKGE